MTRAAIVLLRILIAVMLASALFAQIRFLPGPVAADLRDAGEPTLAVVYPALGAAAVACAEAVLVALWALLSAVRRGAIFDPRAFRWVDAIVVAGMISTALGVAFLSVLGATSPDVPPGILGMVLTAVVANAAFVLVMTVMRQLLRTATELRSELDEVV